MILLNPPATLFKKMRFSNPFGCPTTMAKNEDEDADEEEDEEVSPLSHQRLSYKRDLF